MVSAIFKVFNTSVQADAPEGLLVVPDNPTVFQRITEGLSTPVLITIIIAILAILVAIGLVVALAVRAIRTPASQGQGQGMGPAAQGHGPVQGLYDIPDVVEAPIIVYGPEGAVWQGVALN